MEYTVNCIRTKPFVWIKANFGIHKIWNRQFYTVLVLPKIRSITERIYGTEILHGVHAVGRVVAVLVDTHVVGPRGDHHGVAGTSLGLDQGLVYLVAFVHKL